MASVFVDSEAINMIDYQEKGKTINQKYYALELRQLKDAIKCKIRRKLRALVLLLQDNMHIYTAQVAVAEPANCGFECLEDQNATFFCDEIIMLKHHWTNCIDVMGDYSEKLFCFSDSFLVRLRTF